MIAEDDDWLAEVLQDYLHKAEYETTVVNDGNQVTASVRTSAPALILLDLMLPGKDGLEICREIRSFSKVPIIIVTARIEEIDRIIGLELGADDYVCKPFSPRELLARIKTVLRRSQPLKDLKGFSLEIDDVCHTAILQGQRLDLTPVQFKLFSLFYRNPGRVFSRNQLMDKIYADQRIVSDRTIDGHIKKLRKKISTVTPSLELIHSIYSLGYKYEVTEQQHRMS